LAWRVRARWKWLHPALWAHLREEQEIERERDFAQ
jgi:hypothetical protein